MRKLILILFILLSCASLANSGGIISFPGGGVPSGAFNCAPYIDCQNFETPTTGYDNGETYSVVSGDMNPAYATTPIFGLQSLYDVDDGTNGGVRHYTDPATAFSAGTVYGYFAFKYSTVPTANAWMFQLYDTNVECMTVRLVWDSAVWIYHGNQYESTGILPVAGHTYHVWYDWVKGTGADGVATIYMCDDATCAGVKPAATASETSGDSACTAPDNLIVYMEGGGTGFYDRILTSTSAIGNQPAAN